MTISAPWGSYIFFLDTSCMRRRVMKPNMSSKISRVFNVVIRWSKQGRRLLSKVINTSSSFMDILRHVNWSARDFTLMIWPRISLSSSILMVKNMCLMNKMLDKFLVSWMLHNVFHASAGSLYPLMRATLCPPNSRHWWQGLLALLFIHLLDFVARGVWCWPLRTFHNLPKGFGGQHHFQFELMKVEVVATKLLRHYKSLALTRSHYVNWMKTPTHSIYQWVEEPSMELGFHLKYVEITQTTHSKLFHIQMTIFTLQVGAKQFKTFRKIQQSFLELKTPY